MCTNSIGSEEKLSRWIKRDQMIYIVIALNTFLFYVAILLEVLVHTFTEMQKERTTSFMQEEHSMVNINVLNPCLNFTQLKDGLLPSTALQNVNHKSTHKTARVYSVFSYMVHTNGYYAFLCMCSWIKDPKPQQQKNNYFFLSKI